MKDSKDIYGARGKTNLLTFDPEDLVIVEDTKSPLYDKRHKLPVSERLVRNIMHQGVLEPVLVRKNPETGQTEVVAGRQRVKAAREANKRIIAAGGDPIFVPATVRRGEDGVLASIVVSENEIREDDTPLGRAEKMNRLLSFGKTEDDLTIIFGCSKGTIKNTLSLLDLCQDVRHAVEIETITTTAAYELAKMDVDEQRLTLSKMLVASKTGTSREKAKKVREATGKRSGPNKGDLVQFRAEVESKCGDPTFRTAALSILDWMLGQNECPRIPTKAKKGAAA